MASYRYDRLTAQDNTFLLGETPNTHMHVAGLQIFELGDLAAAGGGVQFDLVRRSIESVLHRIPRYRQRLRWTPITQNPVWVDDPDFSLDYHLRHTALPRPGDEAQLKLLAGRVMSQPLDRERPLWEMWVVEGMQGDRFAIVSKIHHCMIDGVAGSDLAEILLSLKPEKDLPAPAPYIPKPNPSGGELLRDELWRRASLPLRALRGFQAFQRETESLAAEVGVRLKAVTDLIGQALDPPSETPLNGPLGPHRRFDWTSMPLSLIKEMRKAAGCSVNDIVLTIATGAFRDYLLYRNVNPAEITFRISAPVSMRRDDEQGHMGNRVSAWNLDLPIHEADPKQQLSLIHQHTLELKEKRQALGIDMIMKVADWTPPVLLSLGAQAVNGQINSIITNVPGPQFPLYMLGARLLEMMPVVPLLGGVGLGIALFSYDGKITWGFNADYGLVPDLEVFVELIHESAGHLAEALDVDSEAGPDASESS